MKANCVKIVNQDFKRGSFKFSQCRGLQLKLNPVFNHRSAGKGENEEVDEIYGKCLAVLRQTPLSMLRNSLSGLIAVGLVLAIALRIPNPDGINMKAILVGALLAAALVEYLRLRSGRLYFYEYGLIYKSLIVNEECRYDDIEKIDFRLSRRRGFNWIYAVHLKGGGVFYICSYVLKEKYKFNELMAEWARSLEQTGRRPQRVNQPTY